MTQESSAAIDKPDSPRKAIAAAMWSIYYHSIYLRTLRKSVLELVQPPSSAGLYAGRGDVGTSPSHLSALLDVQTQPDAAVPPPLRLLPLNEAVDAVLAAGADDRQASLRRLQALRKLASMGLANPTYREALRKRPHTDAETALRIEKAGKAVDLLAKRVWEEFKLQFDKLETFTRIEPAEANSYLDENLSLSVACAPVATSSVACYSPDGAAGGEPITTITAGAYVKRDLVDLKSVFDPRAWQTTAPDTYQKSQRVTYPGKIDVPHNPNDLGNPWTGYLEEQVVVGGDSWFQNWLEITFQTNPAVRVDYKLKESGKFTIPSLLINNKNENVVVDEGHLLAQVSTNPTYPAIDNWTHIEVVKTIRFVDLTAYAGSNPWNMDPGEVMNYWAPVLFSQWLESGTQVFACCCDR